MKIVFKIIFSLLLLAPPARAQSVYFSTRDLLADFFKKSENVNYPIVNLSRR